MVSHGKKKKPIPKEEIKKKLLERKKEAKQLLKVKRARLIVKNLPFKVTPEKLKEYFEQFGDVKSVELLKKEDGKKLKGCGFVQFDLVQKAAKARHHTNGKEYLGRVLTVDFAKSKQKYEKEIKTEVVKIEEDEINREKNENHEIIEIKDEDVSSTNSDNESDCSSNESVKSESETGNEYKEEIENTNEEKKSNFSNDIIEGKTVFVKNVPFDATNDDLKQCMRQFGRIFYALICVDKLTEHSKGTAFVKFLDKEDAEKALNAGTELTLLGNVLDCHPALDRSSVNKKISDVKESKLQPKDSRQLYLVKEGVILAGSPAAKGVSATDMAKRLQIEQYKTQMLRNLNMFVSKDRLVVHNLPPAWDDKKLKTLFQKFGGAGASIKEARIMKDMKNVDSSGIGKSKEYGFVTFSTHENALTALRNLNNNPQIFSQHKRPIITFSIENKGIIKARQKRLDKSKRNNNPLSGHEEKEKNYKKKTGKITRKGFKQKKKLETNNEDEPAKYSGVTTKPGVKEKMRSRYKLATQAKLHNENLKKEKKRKKNAKKSLADKRKEFIKQPKQKVNQVKEKDNFSKLVSDYKKKLVNVPAIGKTSKWYD